MIKRSENVVIAVIVVVALALRLIAIDQSLWLDEAINVTAARDRTLVSLLGEYAVGDFHPPLYHLLLWSWFRVLPASEVASRLPSVIFGTLTVYVVYEIGKALSLKKKNRQWGVWLAPLLLSTSGLHVYYSQEARMYALAALTGALTLLSALKVREDPTGKRKLIYVGSLVSMLLSDYQPWLLLPLLLFLFPGLTSAALLATIPWWTKLLQQLESGMAAAREYPAWGAVVGGLSVKSVLLVPVKFLVGRISLDDNLLFTLVLLMPAGAAVLLIRQAVRRWDRSTKLLTAWIGTPLLVGVLVALQVPIFTYFRFLFVLPIVYLLLAIGAGRIMSSRVRFAAVAILIATNLFSTFAYLGGPQFQRENWREAVGYVHGFDPERTLVVFPNLAQAAAFDYYNAGRMETQDRTNLDLWGYEEIFFVRYVADLFDPQQDIPAALGEAEFEKIEESNFQGIVLERYNRERTI